MTTPIRHLILPAAALVLALSACGDGDATPTASEASASPSVAATEPASPSPSAASPSASASADGTAGADAPEGWERIAVDGAGFSVAVPEGWEELSASELAEADFDDLREANPGAAAVLEQAQQALESGQVALFAFDPEVGESEFATNLNVINVGSVTGTAEEAGEEVAAAIEQQIPVTGPVETETTTLPAGEAAVIRYEWDVASASGAQPTPVTVVQYAIIAESGSGFILSMSAATAEIRDDEETFRQIAELFRETSD